MKFLEPIDSQIPSEKIKSIGDGTYKSGNISKLLIDSQIPSEKIKSMGDGTKVLT